MSTPDGQSRKAAQVQGQTEVAPRAAKPSQPWLWNVVLLDDQDHTYDYVIRMMQDLFGHSKDKAHQIAQMVDKQGRAVCATTHKEHAELKREQVHAFGRDPHIPDCKGAMSAIIEPAEGDDDKPGSDKPGA